jgi:hypothetical protein
MLHLQCCSYVLIDSSVSLLIQLISFEFECIVLKNHVNIHYIAIIQSNKTSSAFDEEQHGKTERY